MIKSLALTTIMCALNTGGSFNIHQQNAQWEENRTTYKNNTSNITLNANIGTNFNYWNKNIYTYEDNYIKIETIILTNYTWEIEEQNDGWSKLTTITQVFNHYQTFSINANLFNTYTTITQRNGFTDNIKTGYTWNYNNPRITKEVSYTATENTKNAVHVIKNESNGYTMQQDIMSFNTALNQITSKDTTINGTINKKNNEFTYKQKDIEERENYELWSYDVIYDDNIDLVVTTQGQIIDDTNKFENWYNQFYQIIDGERVFNAQFETTDISINQTAYYLVVDTGGTTSPEVIDIGGIMWDIIGMPFTFINQAFNVTLFPGTIYEFNIGTLFKGMIAILAVLFVVKLFTRGIDVLGAYTGAEQDARFKRENQQMKRERHQMDKEKHAKEMAKTNKKE